MEEVAGRRKRHMLRNGGSHTRAEWLELQRLYDSRCWVPGCDQPGASKDHYIPVSKGGTDDIANIRPCCRRHNSMKSNKMPEEFLERLQFNNQEVQSWATR
jgi:5-methylcytosine-specific restriction endonuclease McrA